MLPPLGVDAYLWGGHARLDAAGLMDFAHWQTGWLFETVAGLAEHRKAARRLESRVDLLVGCSDMSAGDSNSVLLHFSLLASEWTSQSQDGQVTVAPVARPCLSPNNLINEPAI